jgi:hypothetical protein
MPEDDKPVESEQAVIDEHGEVAEDQIARATENARKHPNEASVGEAMQDPGAHEEVPFDEHAANPSSTGPEGLEGDMGVSSARTTPGHQRTDSARDVSPGTYDAPDVATDGPGPEAEDYDNKSWDGGAMRVSGEPRPAPIEDEKSRRDNKDPKPMP